MKPRHVYRPPRKNRFLSTAIIFSGGLIFTFLVFYLIPLMQKLDQSMKDEEPDLVANITVAPEDEYVPPEQEPEPEEEPEPEPEPMEADDIAVEAIDLPSLGAGTGGKVILDITPKMALGDSGALGGAEGVDADPRPRTSFDPSVPNSVMKVLAKRGAVQVIVSGLVSEKGAVVETSIAKSSGIPALDTAAMNALRRWKFDPAIKGGRKARATIQQPFNFRVK